MGIDVVEAERRGYGRRSDFREVKRPSAAPATGFRIDMDISGFLGYVDALQDGCEVAVRPAAQAGAQVMYDLVKTNVNALGQKTGNLRKSIYQVFSRDNSGPVRAEYHISWNNKKAPHGHLVEFGHVQRYVTYIDKRGQWKTLVRAEMRGKPRPKRTAPLSVKDAYYVPLKGGPRLVGARAFVRSAITPGNIRRSQDAMVARWWNELEARGLL